MNQTRPRNIYHCSYQVLFFFLDSSNLHFFDYYKVIVVL